MEVIVSMEDIVSMKDDQIQLFEIQLMMPKYSLSPKVFGKNDFVKSKNLRNLIKKHLESTNFG